MIYNPTPITINKIGKSLSSEEETKNDKLVNRKKLWIFSFFIFSIVLVFVITSTLFKQNIGKPIKGIIYEKSIEAIQHKHHQSNDYKILFKPIGYECIIVLDVSDNEFVNKKIGDEVTYNIGKGSIVDTPCKNQLISQYNLNEKEYFIGSFLMGLMCTAFFSIILALILWGLEYK